ncbi:VWA domain-containing protein [Micromonospora sp. NBC_01699]|uniref:vWA domain-containing protein n=1 Tax=Micromonospora sp. NBC_01699 TaxID=2975984 RepID=UPI002E2C36DC|nr:vWA domain-containing protein [Micromonospora sp. NBC_01699]
MSAGPSFDISTHYEMYLPTEGTLVDVVATVRSTGTAAGDGRSGSVAPHLAEVILLDCSGSMGSPTSKLIQARRAAAAAIDALPDGVRFAVVAGTHTAEMIYPGVARLTVASDATRAAAKEALRRTGAGGGTAMSSWLRLAARIFEEVPGSVRHAILLTDGRNESEPVTELDAVLGECAGHYTVDCRAIAERPGVHAWRGTELIRIADALGANPVVPVEDLDRLSAEFTQLVAGALGQRTADVRLRVRTSALAGVRFVKQVYPTIADLAELAQPVDGQTTDYPIGSWGEGHRDYHIGLAVQPMAANETRRVAWLSLLVPGAVEPADAVPDRDRPDRVGAAEVGQTAVAVEWTEDIARYTGINPTVAHYTRQQELAVAIRAAWEAFDERRLADAEALMGRAVALAYAAGAHDKLAVFGRVVEIEDGAAGRVRLRSDVDPGHWQVPTVTGHHTRSWDTAGPTGFSVHDASGPGPAGVGTPGLPGQRSVAPADANVDPLPDECPECQTRRRGRFCERCRYDFQASRTG